MKFKNLDIVAAFLFELIHTNEQTEEEKGQVKGAMRMNSRKKILPYLHKQREKT